MWTGFLKVPSLPIYLSNAYVGFRIEDEDLEDYAPSIAQDEPRLRRVVGEAHAVLLDSGGERETLVRGEV